MKKYLLAVAALGVAGVVMAAQVLPTSNVLGDTAATASTLVYRDTNGVFDAASLQDGTVVTAKLAQSSVTTAKTFLDLTADKLLCVTSTKRIGQCSTAAVGSGTCTCQ